MRKYFLLLIISIISFPTRGQGSDFQTEYQWLLDQLDIIPSNEKTEFELLLIKDIGITNGGQVIQLVKTNDQWNGKI